MAAVSSRLLVVSVSIMLILAGLLGWQRGAARLEQAELTDPNPRPVLLAR
jgi:hypothetical protein